MIVRVLRARVRAGKVGSFNALFRSQVPLLREQPGLVYVKLARRLQNDGSEEVVLFEEWEDSASLYAWVGPNLNTPRLVPGARELMDDLVVAHYEALDRDALEPNTEETDGAAPGSSAGPASPAGSARPAAADDGARAGGG